MKEKLPDVPDTEKACLIMFDRFFFRVANDLLNHVPNHHLFEDLCQEGRMAMIKAYRRLDRTRSMDEQRVYLMVTVRGEMRKWLNRCGYSIRIPAWKSERAGFERSDDARTCLLDDARDAPNTGIDADLEQVFNRIAFIALLKKTRLTWRERQALRLHLAERISLREASARLGLSVHYLHNALSTAKRKLREAYERDLAA